MAESLSSLQKSEFFCQNDPPIRESFWQKDSLITHIHFELCLFRNFAQHTFFLLTLYIKRHNPNLVTIRYAERSLEFQNQLGPIFFNVSVYSNAYSETGSNNHTGPMYLTHRMGCFNSWTSWKNQFGSKLTTQNPKIINNKD